MKKTIHIIFITMMILAMTTSAALAGGNARRPAILVAADRVVELQRTDVGWQGTWFWYVGNTYNATNLTGVTALGLLEAYRDTKDLAYLDAAIGAANFIMEHLGAGATGMKYHVRTTAPDIVFLHQLGAVTSDTSYGVRATLEWNNITSFWSTAGALDTYFRTIGRRSAWDMAFFLEAAYLSGDTAWADDAAAILANTSDTFYYGTDTWWYALNVAGAIRSLVNCGYGELSHEQIVGLLGALISLVDDDTGVGGYIQDTAYAVLAFRAIGGAAERYANDLARWLAAQQADTGGWIEPDLKEYPEVNGEALRALASTIGTNITLDGFEYGTSQIMNSSWVKGVSTHETVPFSGE
jgi:hypothetical protein